MQTRSKKRLVFFIGLAFLSGLSFFILEAPKIFNAFELEKLLEYPFTTAILLFLFAVFSRKVLREFGLSEYFFIPDALIAVSLIGILLELRHIDKFFLNGVNAAIKEQAVNITDKVKILDDSLQNIQKELNEINRGFKDVNSNYSKLTCESLKGNYKFHSSYVYIVNDDIRGTAIDAEWNATTCTKNEDNTYSLKGNDMSKHLVEVFMDGVYKSFAIVDSPYQSTITIGSDGKLLKRVINNLNDLPIHHRTNVDKFDANTNILLGEKVNNYIKLLNKKHKDIDTCFPASYKDKSNNKTFIVSICPDYVRTLVKQDN